MGTGFAYEPVDRSVEWYTPPEIFVGIPLAFDLDPASPMNGPVTPCKRFLTLADDGLMSPWNGHVWLNPPYDRRMVNWIGRMNRHNDGIALLLARTDTTWWHGMSATTFLFLRSRVRFISPDPKKQKGSPTAPSVLVAWGTACEDALAKSTLSGMLLTCPQSSKGGA